MAREVQVGIIALIALLTILVVWEPFMSFNSTFSELAVLGPDQNLGGYPTQLIVGQPFVLYGLVENHEGLAEYYKFIVKLGNESTQISNSTGADAPVLFTSFCILGSGQNRTFPIYLTLNESGLNQRMIFELWRYSATQYSFAYTGLWNEVWVNVTF